MELITALGTGLGAGLLAGGASCAVVQGGLLAGAVDGGRATSHCVAPVAVKTRVVRTLTAFLGAKLAVHTALGALLGLAGAAVQPPPSARAVLLLAAAVLMALFALDMLGVPGLGRLLPRVPGGSKTSGTGSGRPAALGAATVLLPCGVTLSMELVAVASGNALTGAAVMAAFVLGTVPLNAALGWALDVSTRVLRGRLVRVVGVCVLAVAVWTALSGLRLGGWYAPQSSAAADGGAARMGADGVQTVTVRAVKDGYRPARVAARAGVPTVLLLRSADLYGCTRAVVIPGRDVQRLLPATGETTIDLGVPDSGALKFSCAMGMYGGRIDFSATP